MPKLMFTTGEEIAKFVEDAVEAGKHLPPLKPWTARQRRAWEKRMAKLEEEHERHCCLCGRGGP
jgi:hypothetical protein